MELCKLVRQWAGRALHLLIKIAKEIARKVQEARDHDTHTLEGKGEAGPRHRGTMAVATRPRATSTSPGLAPVTVMIPP